MKWGPIFDKIDNETAILYNFINQFIKIKVFKKTKSVTNYDIIYKFLTILYTFQQSLYLLYKKLLCFLIKSWDIDK